MQSDTPRSPDHATTALELWEAGDLAAAEKTTREALLLLPAGDSTCPHVRLQLASILAALGRPEEARKEFEVALQEELSQIDGNTNNPAIRAARFFLGEHLVRIGDSAAALETITPGLGQPGDRILRLVESDAHRALGHTDDAVKALRLALEAAETDEQREDIQMRLSEVLRPRKSAHDAG
jgi:tetratricopeptide (TPR) repeat protein